MGLRTYWGSRCDHSWRLFERVSRPACHGTPRASGLQVRITCGVCEAVKKLGEARGGWRSVRTHVEKL
eukprot:scaffold708_cov19-Tisochrysis_lutea.AAC.4